GAVRAVRGGNPPYSSAQPTPVFIFYSLFFLIYYLKRTTNGRPYIDLFDLKTDDQWSPLH
ncbi:MAG: hypothetical protein IKH51_09820, partial [Clostridia bacterium]|nr:hypothetical protein [Clostridia bacterium]